MTWGRGLRGEIGKMGLKGNQGDQGNPGFTGEEGSEGAPGATGAEGAPGRDARNPTRRLWIIFIFTVLVFLLLSYRQEQATDRIEANAAKISDLQTRTSEEVLCPLYVIFLESLENPDPGDVDTPAERKQFAAYKVTIQDGYDKLGCPA